MAQTKAGALLVAAKKVGISAEEYARRVASGLKHCMRCRQWVARSEFSRDTTRHDGLNTVCGSCRRVKVRRCMKGRVSAFKGRKHTAEARAAMSAARMGKPGIGRPKGMKHTAETRAKISRVTKERTPRGEAHYAFTHGKHQRDKSDRRKPEYKEWRDAVYARDRYTCQACGDNRGGNLQAHHVKSFADHTELRFVVSNGTTLCQDCHERLHLKPIPTHSDLRRRKKHLAHACDEATIRASASG